MIAMQKSLLVGGVMSLLVLSGVGTYQYISLTKALAESERSLRETQRLAQENESRLIQELATKTEENITLAGTLRALEDENAEGKRTVRTLSSTVNDLEKIVATDPELLAKYSKVYFLNENYAPRALAEIPSEYGFQPDRSYEVHAEVSPRVTKMLEDAKEDGLSLMVASAYRSFSAQAALKSGYRVRYGTGANAFSAEQGYSEHQLGTAIDFTTPTVGGTFVGFDRTDEYAWLTKHAWKYGFVLSYPKGNSYYQYEPWHWRFVGRDLAERLHEDEDWFYDLDQRTIDTYLGVLFD